MKRSHNQRTPIKNYSKLNVDRLDISLSYSGKNKPVVNRQIHSDERPALSVNVMFLQSPSSAELTKHLRKATVNTRVDTQYPLTGMKITNKFQSESNVGTNQLKLSTREKHGVVQSLSHIEETEEIEYSKENGKESNCEVIDEDDVYESADSEKEVFYSASSSLLPSINLIVDSDSESINDLRCELKEKKTEVKKEYLCPSWNPKSLSKERSNKNDKANNLPMKDGKINTNSHLLNLDDITARLYVNLESSTDNSCPDDIDYSLSGSISGTDMLIVVYSDDDELSAILNHNRGVISYVKKYWSGFFPLFLIYLGQDSTPVKESTSLLLSHFSCCHRLLLQDSYKDMKFLLEMVVRYHMHTRQLQCKGAIILPSLTREDWKCPGLCQLQTCNTSRKRTTSKKKTFFQSVRRTLTVKRTIQRRTRSMHGNATVPYSNKNKT